MRKDVHLNFDWQFIGQVQEPHIADIDWAEKASVVDIPHTSQELPCNNFDERSYQCQSAYRKTLEPSLFTGVSHALLRFEGVMVSCKVFINETLVVESDSGFLPFEADILPYVHRDQPSELLVLVDASENPEIPPFGHVVDFLTYGGIYREVRLTLLEHVYVHNARIVTELSYSRPDSDSTQAQVHADLYLNNPAGAIHEVTLDLRVNDQQGNTIHQEQFTRTLSGASEEVWSHTLSITDSDIKCWSLDQPTLYTLETKLSGSKPLDANEFQFGFRTVKFRPNGFYLNGERVKLVGLNRHQSYPYVGYAMPASAQARDAELLKFELGCNCVRSSHYPPSPHFLNRCDEIGLLVFNEIPGWQHIGEEPAWHQRALDNVHGMIERDWNHPSVFIWGVRINESADCHKLYKATNALARKLDPSRPTGGVRCIANSELLEDVYTFNDFSHTGRNAPLQKRQQVAGAEVPYLVTEHCGHMFPTKASDTQDRLLEHALRHARVINKAFSRHEYSGAIGWVMADYNTHEDFGSGDRVCYHGVLDMFREPKYAAAVYASQQDRHPVMELAGNMKNGDYDRAQFGALWVFTNCDSIRLYKNDQYLQTFYPDSRGFPHLPHPPVILDDFIGDQIARHESFSPRDADSIRQLFSAVNRKGLDGLNLWEKTRMLWLLRKNGLTIEDGIDLFAKYIGNWGDASASYRLEGYRNGQCVIRKTRGKSRLAVLEVKADNTCLTQRQTYDVTRVSIRCLDEDQMVRHYASNPVQIKVSSGLLLIGPALRTLSAGQTAFWVRTAGVRGQETVTVTSDQFEPQTITLQID